MYSFESGNFSVAALESFDKKLSSNDDDGWLAFDAAFGKSVAATQFWVVTWWFFSITFHGSGSTILIGHYHSSEKKMCVANNNNNK